MFSKLIYCRKIRHLLVKITEFSWVKNMKLISTIKLSESLPNAKRIRRHSADSKLNAADLEKFSLSRRKHSDLHLPYSFDPLYFFGQTLGFSNVPDNYYINIENLSLILFQTSPGLYVCRKSLLKTMWEKEKLLVTNNFSFSNSILYPFGELSAIFINFKLPFANSFSFEESKICCLGQD